MADQMGGGDPHLAPWLYGGAGAGLGLIARSKHWIDATGRWSWRVFSADVTSGGRIVVVAIAIAAALHLEGAYIAAISATMMWLGLDPLRDRALGLIDKLIDAVADRVRGFDDKKPPKK